MNKKVHSKKTKILFHLSVLFFTMAPATSHTYDTNPTNYDKTVQEWRSINKQSTDKLKKRYTKFIEENNNNMAIRIKLAIDLIQEGEIKISESNSSLEDITEFNDAIKLLRRINSEYELNSNGNSLYSAKDTSLYFLAKAYDLNNQHKLYQSTLIDLVSNYPKSYYADEAAFRVAEAFFSYENYSSSTEYYKKVLENKSSKFYDFSSYMLGWSLYKDNKHDSAIQQFLSVLDEIWVKKGTDEKLLTDRLDKIENDSIRALALSIDHSRNKKSLKITTKAIENKIYEPLVFRKLADIYIDQKRYQDASDVYWNYIKKHPLDSISFTFANQSNEILKNSGFKSQYIEDEERLTSNYGKDSSYYQNLSLLEKTKTDSILEVKALSIAEYHYQEALKYNKYDNAILWHNKFIKNHPKSPHLKQILYALGDMYEKNKNYEAAYQAYFKLAYEIKSDIGNNAAYSAYLIANKKHTIESNAVIDTIKLTESIQKKEKPKPTENNKNWAYRLYFNSYLYSLQYGEDDRIVHSILNAAQVAAKRKDWPLSIALSNYAKSLEKVKSDKEANLKFSFISAQSKFNQGNYLSAIDDYLYIDKNYSNITNKKTIKLDDIKNQIILSKFLLLKGIEKDVKQNNKVLSLRKELSKQDKNKAIQRKAIISLVNYFTNSNQIVLAEENLNNFDNLFPSDPMILTMTIRMVNYYQAKGNLEKAAKHMISVYKMSNNVDEKREANLKIAQWKNDLGQKKQAIEWFKKYAHTYKKPALENLEVQNKLQTIYKDLAKSDKKYIKKRMFWLNKIVNSYQENSLKELREKTIAAKANIAIADYQFEKFVNIKIQHPIEKSFHIKNNLMKKAIETYKKSIDFNFQSISSHAYYKLAEMYGNLAHSMLQAPVPKGLSSLEIDEYNILLEEQAYPFEEKSISIHKKNSELSYSGFYNNYIEKSFNKLSELLPARYKRNEIELDFIDEI